MTGCQRDATASTTGATDHSVPSGPGIDLDALPALVGEGWLRADEETGDEKRRLSLTDEEQERHRLSLSFYTTPYHNIPLTQLPEYNDHHVKQLGESGNSGHGKTFVAGDFYLDWRRDGRRWNGMEWTGGHSEVRVRRRPDTPEHETVVIDRETAEALLDLIDDPDHPAAVRLGDALPTE